ncbi:YARHG domain-containing protein [Lachnospiraceae bacterium 54-53]
MKPYPFIPIILTAAALLTAGCGKNTGQTPEPEGSGTVRTAEESAGAGTNTAGAPPDGQLPVKEGSADMVTVKAWSEQKNRKYSDSGQLIYEWNIRVPQVVISDNYKAQYRLNRFLRENDKESKRDNFISDALENHSHAVQNGEEWQENAITYDYKVLKNDGLLLSLRQDYYEYSGGLRGEYSSYLDSFDTETGQKLTLDSLAENPEELKLALRQNISGQIRSGAADESIVQKVMSADINNFAFLSDGIKVLYNLYELGGPYALGSQECLVPYEKVESQLNEYGKQLAVHAAGHPDEPEAAKPAPDFVFPESSSSVLTGADLLGADASGLRLARNEIFARHGRTFEDPGLQDYFDQKTWYHGEASPGEFDEGVLNETEKKNLELIRTAEEQLKSGEITDSGLVLEPDREYRLDLDGDGTWESISWSSSGDGEDWIHTKMDFFINGRKQDCFPENLRGNFIWSALDLQKEDEEIELHLAATEDSATLSSFSFYRYQNGKLEQIADLAGEVCGGYGNLYRQNGLRAEGDGILAVSADTPFTGASGQFGCYFVDLLFSYENGRLEEIPQEIYPKTDYDPVTSAFRHDNEPQYYVVSTEFSAMEEADGNTPAFLARPGETVCPAAWSLRDGKLYVLVMNEAGVCGWVKELPWDMSPENALYVAVPAWG